MEFRIVREDLIGGFYRESLVRYDQAFGDPVGVQEVLESDDVQHVAGIDLGTHRFPGLHIISVQYRDVPGAFGTCLAGVIGQGIDGAFV